MRELLGGIYERIRENPDREESEVTDVFVEADFFSRLGYDGIGIDVRSEKHIVGQNRPDYFAKDDYGNVVFVIEFKKPSLDDDLASHRSQLWERYVKPLRADYGILTDGEELILYERETRDRAERRFRRSLDNITEEETAVLERLRKPELTLSSKTELGEYFEEIEPVSLGVQTDGEPIGRREFFDTFRLERGTLFYRMLERTYELIDYRLEHGGRDDFLRDAYEFWDEYYAADPGWYDLPSEWREIAGSADNKQKVMFAVETVQSILGRLMLAKACEDYEFPNINVSAFVEDRTRDYRGNVSHVAYVEVASRLMDQMREELVESVFEQDLYYWWDTLAEDVDDLSDRELHDHDWPAPVERFGAGFAEFMVAISRFDFSAIQGDPLGDLYQEYFDPATRRALGEFYTPPSIVDYILDSVEYEHGIQNKRLVDPACGSGTFLVEALQRYKATIGPDPDWAAVLHDLCERSRIVGIDIHPFAVVLAQIRFMLEILPEYRQAIEDDPGFVLKRLPIYRTDSLIDETELDVGVQQSLFATRREEFMEFEMTLPVRDGEEFESMKFELPKRDYVRSQTAHEVDLQEEYLASLLAVFDVVKSFASEVDDPESTDYEIERAVLHEEMLGYFGAHKNVTQIAETFLDTTNEFLGQVEELHRDYDDGRLLKLIEDVVLGSILKNTFDYHYVVGNPPWVSKHSRYHDAAHDRRMKQQYLSAWKETDTYLQFTERGLGMLTSGGRLGFIVSNRFLYNMSGEEIRGLLAKNRIHELVDFTDVMLFEDATNYSAILSVEKRVPNDEWDEFIEDGRFAERYSIDAARVRDWDTDDIPGLMDNLSRRETTDGLDVFEVESRRFQERIGVRNGRIEREEVSKQFTGTDEADTATKQLPQADVWPVAPPSEYDLLDRIENAMDTRLGNRTVIREHEIEDADSLVGDEIRQGIITSGDGAYVVEPATTISESEIRTLDTLTIRTDSIDREFLVETDLLKLDITGKDTGRWLPDWDGRLVFVPYVQGDDRAELIRPTTLASDHAQTWDYFTDPDVLAQLSEESKERKEVHNRLAARRGIIEDQGTEQAFRRFDLSSRQRRDLSEQLHENPGWLERQDSDLWWYRFMRRQNIESLPLPKMLTGNQAQYNKLSFDNDGKMAPHNARVYSIMLEERNREAVAAVLNSAVAEFWHQHHARIHAGKAYSYIKDYTAKWPVVVPEGETAAELDGLVAEILDAKTLETRVGEFPDPYVAEARDEGHEFASLTYTPSQTFEADPSLQSEMGGGRRVVLAGGDLTDDLLAAEPTAEYVVATLRGRRLERDTTHAVSVPIEERVAADLLEEYTDDRDALAERDVPELERRIDDLVFDAYGIHDAADRELIRRYNTQYEAVRPLDPSVE